MIYIIYISFFMLFVIMYHYKTIKKYLIKVFSNKKNLRDISIGLFAGAIVALIGSPSVVHAVAYGVLTIVSLIGIINSNS